MIPFFRKIRHKLLSQNQVTRYLIYALGEILLVVIGILIALWVNNLNEEAKQKAFEQKMLKEIHSALESDIEFFEDHLIGFRLKTQKKATNFFNNYYLTNQINNDSIDYYFRALEFGFQYTYNRGPYDALKSGGLEKVENDSLRVQLTQLYDFLHPRWSGLIAISNARIQNQMEKIKPKLMSLRGFEIREGKVIHLGDGLKNPSQIKTQEFIRMVGLSEFQANSQEQYLQSLILQMKDLLGLIEAEITP